MVRKLDEKAVEPLILMLRNKDSEADRVTAARGLGDFRDHPGTVEALLAAVEDANPVVRAAAVASLGGIRLAVEPLIASTKDDDFRVRSNAWRALAEIRGISEAEAALDAALVARDLQAVAAASNYFIRKGEPGTERILIDALEAHGTHFLAQRFLNARNDELDEAARSWAAVRGYRVVNRPSGTGESYWGSAGR